MDPFAVSHLSDEGLLHDAKRLLGQGFMTNAMLLTRITEIDRRKLYLREGYPSLYAYITCDWHLTEDEAYKRIHAARAAHRFPAILIALAEGRLHMRAVLMLAAHLTPANVDDLVAAATHKSRFEIQRLLAERFPQPDVSERLEPLGPPRSVTTGLELSPGAVGQLAPEQVLVTIPEQSPQGQAHALPLDPSRTHVHVRIEPPSPAAKVTPLASQRYAFQCTFDQETHELLEDVRALMSHEVPTPDTVQVLRGALKIAKAHLMKRKFAATDCPRPSRPSSSARHIPAAVRRAVWKRDGGRCAFVSDGGRRCEERAGLEYDHIQPVARGGEATADNVRLMCRAHNQHEAERAFGVDFIERKRREARGARRRQQQE